MMLTARGVRVETAAVTDPGRDPDKQVNEDSHAVLVTPLGLLAVVCDGMGGHEGGQLASTTAIKTIETVLTASPPELPAVEGLRAAIEQANLAVYAIGDDTPTLSRPGATCVAFLLHSSVTEIAHVGDSRAFLLRDREVSRITRDHSVVQQMVDAGMLTEEQAQEHPDANRITRALGVGPQVEVELRGAPLVLQEGDVLALCSDGLSDLVHYRELAPHLGQLDLQAGCQALVELANARGGHDNITVVAVRVLALPKEDSLPPTVAGSSGTVKMPQHHGDGDGDGDTQSSIYDASALRPLAPAATTDPRRAFPGEEPTMNTVLPALSLPATPPLVPRGVLLGMVALTVAIVLGIALWALLGGHR
jgi:serine/threonine protein phosphatase PrpC